MGVLDTYVLRTLTLIDSVQAGNSWSSFWRWKLEYNLSKCTPLRSSFDMHHSYPFTAIYIEHNWCPGGIPCWLGCGSPVHWTQRHPGYLIWQAVPSFVQLTLFNDPPSKTALTGVFLFASTTARSSNALLGWNCGYVFHSNVRRLSPNG